MDADGANARALTALGPAALASQPCFSPDGRHVAFTLVRSKQGPLTIDALLTLQFRVNVWVVQADGSNPHRLTSDGLSSEAAWAP